MQYQARVKFNAALDANGDIVPGSAYAGFLTSELSAGDYGVYHLLLEHPPTNNWEICRYDATQAAGSRRVTLYSGSGSALDGPLTGLNCSLVAHPNSYVLNTHTYLSDYPPIVRSANSTGIGAGPDIGVGSPNSLAINGTVRDDSPRSVVAGGWAGSPETVSIGFEASTEVFADQATYESINTAGSIAIGYRARATAAGEVALGSANTSHTSGIPLMTDDPSGGGTFLFKAVAGYDSDNDVFILANIAGGNETYKPPYPASSPQWVIHVQGTIVARADDAADGKVVKVEWVTGGALVQTVLTQGANDISLGLALNGMRLQATVDAVAGLKLAGYLHLTKVALPQY